VKRNARGVVGTLAALALLSVWYSVAANYDYDALAGTYVLHSGIETCILHLRTDHTFTEELNHAGKIQKVQGVWRRYGQSHVSFSSEFLMLVGQQPNVSGEAHGQFEKTLGLFPSLTLAPIPDGPTLRKELLR
jgi:hypothetical protein